MRFISKAANCAARPDRSHHAPDALRQALHTGAGMMALHGLGFVTSILIARALGPAGQGKFQVILSIAIFVTLVTTGGLDEAVAYLLPRYAVDKPQKTRALMIYALCSTGLVSIMVGALFFTTARVGEHLLRIAGIARDLRALLLLCPALMVLSMSLAILRGVGRSDWRAYINYYIVGGLYFAAVAVLSLRSLSPADAYAARIGSLGIGALVALVILFRQRLGDTAALGRDDLWTIHTFAGWLVFVGIFQYAIEQPLVDLLIVARYDTIVSVGLYSVAAKAAGVIATGSIALGVVIAPVFARAAAERDFTRLRAQYRRASLWMAISALLFGAIVLLSPGRLLAIFGRDYEVATRILVVFAAAQIATGVLGLNGPLLVACGRARIEFCITAAGAIIFVVTGVFCARIFGAIGVATVSAATTVAIAVARRVAVAFVMNRMRGWS